MIPKIIPMSKMDLKQMCLISAKGDIENAERLYDFMIKDMEELPAFTPIRPSAIEQIKNGVSDTFQWVNENQDGIAKWIGFLKSMFNKNGGGNVPPEASASVTPLPNIN